MDFKNFSDMGKNTYFFLASFLEMAELFWLELSRKVQPGTATWHGKFSQNSYILALL